MKSADGRELTFSRNTGSTLVISMVGRGNGKPRTIMELPPGGVDELLAGLQSHTSAALENYAATEDGRDVGLACKADRVLFFVNGRRVLEVANEDLGGFVNALRPKDQLGDELERLGSSSSNQPRRSSSSPTSAELIRSRKFLEQVQVARYTTITNVEPPDPNPITWDDITVFTAPTTRLFVRIGDGEWFDSGVISDRVVSLYFGVSGPNDNGVRAEQAAE